MLVARAQAFGAPRSQELIKQSIDRGLKAARSEIVRTLRTVVPKVPRSELLDRVALVRRDDPAEAQLRLRGAGRGGRGFLRPRHLGLPMSKRGAVEWSADGQRETPENAFVMSPLGGKEFGLRGTKAFDRRRALVWQRVNGRRDQIRRVNEPFTVGWLMNRNGRLAAARAVITEKARGELKRRIEVEAKRR